MAQIGNQTYNPNSIVPADVWTGNFTGQQQFILNAFRSQTYIQDQVDVQHEPLYDTISVTGGATAINQTNNQFFSNVTQQSGKTLAQTNLTQNNSLKTPEAFAIFQYRLYLFPGNTLVDNIAMVNQYAYQFTLGSKPYQTAPVWMLPAGGGLWGVTTATTTSLYGNGWPSKDAVRPLAVTLVIENTASFVGTLVVGTAYTPLSAFQIMNVLDGLHARGIQ
jgi:hypothetical protein